jgi:hypothetical protein
MPGSLIAQGGENVGVQAVWPDKTELAGPNGAAEPDGVTEQNGVTEPNGVAEYDGVAEPNGVTEPVGVAEQTRVGGLQEQFIASPLHGDRSQQAN